ncbi:MAG: hypothetical protein L0G39_14090 [Chryseobacterium sp.]|uniref:hypothetical protein n=1 Tax=Chryseobacterium carnipullorum TaxID=1124835 RepID=UPI0009182C06|nr:hypothetical protein [Chryseobacterium carnipullorum]MDN5395371.1 hypothetical protein [Chryseobacterium sp.]MDN5422141.1 hypothetical protein [Chryseobacterium sp.]MDN5478064.1 hypothetical protein [Chryseobacterium sp.]MDN5480440.1 hypothetical protein [Chryseobacterium sp.]SHL80193.1 hypothetical protein SAMN05444360_104234 [Chryseobacterium carnipullorum]
MTIPLLDIVFQNDRYYLLFDDERILETSVSKEWYLYADGNYVCSIDNCKVSELLKVPGKIFLETRENLNQLENSFRRLKNVMLSSDKINL